MYNIDFTDILAEVHCNQVKNKIQSLTQRIIDGKECKMNKVRYKANQSTIIYLKKLLEDAYLEKLIKGHPDQLRDIIKNIDNSAFLVPPKKTRESNLNTKYNLNRILYYIFIFSIYEKQGSFDKEKFIENIAIKTCPYCNRSYIYMVRNERNLKIVKPQIDHFFPKSKYPFLGLSYYNLIPSCLLCNSLECKAEISPISDDSNPLNTQIVRNPYEFDDNELKFSFHYDTKIALPIDLFSITINDIKMDYNGDKGLWYGYESIFALKSLYEKHKNYIMEIVSKLIYMYNSSNLVYLSTQTGHRIDESDILKIFWGFPLDKKEAKNRILTKFLNDILDQVKEYQSKGFFSIAP
jgi:hypothetical protein